jgi:hypothetical protein
MKKHSAHIRKHKAGGGPMKGDVVKDEAPSEVYAGKGSNVEAEAKEKKRGGRAMKHVGHVAGHKAKARADRPARKSGGRIGCEASPFSSAARGTEPKAHKSYEPERK